MSEQNLGFRKTGAGTSLGVVVPETSSEAPASTVPTNPSPTPTSTPRPAKGGLQGGK